MAEDIKMSKRKRIALVAHNNKKTELIDCLKQHCEVLSQHELFGTGTTGTLVEQQLNLPVTKFKSGPLGGDQQLGAKIASQELDMLFFLIDPLDSHPHSADVQGLLRLAQVWNILCATTTSTIDCILASPRINESHTRRVHLFPVIPTAANDKKKPTVSSQTRRVPVMKEKSKLKLPLLSPTQRRFA